MKTCIFKRGRDCWGITSYTLAHETTRGIPNSAVTGAIRKGISWNTSKGSRNFVMRTFSNLFLLCFLVTLGSTQVGLITWLCSSECLSLYMFIFMWSCADTRRECRYFRNGHRVLYWQMCPIYDVCIVLWVVVSAFTPQLPQWPSVEQIIRHQRVIGRLPTPTLFSNFSRHFELPALRKYLNKSNNSSLLVGQQIIVRGF
jgi:hypothetical protein